MQIANSSYFQFTDLFSNCPAWNNEDEDIERKGMTGWIRTKNLNENEENGYLRVWEETEFWKHWREEQ